MTLDSSTRRSAGGAAARSGLRPVTRPPQVLAVDCQPLFVFGLSQCVRQRLPWLHWAGSVLLPAPVVAVVNRVRPDLVVLNAAAIGLNRAAMLVRALRSLDVPGLPHALAVLALVPDAAALGPLRTSGANGVTRVTDTPVELATAMERTLREGRFVSPALSADEPAAPAGQPEVALQRPNLTAREREVLFLIADGLDTDGMADRLGVGRETVRTHVRALLRKLGADDRAYAVARAFRFGFLR
jgi:DNA-binding NarL/FixJ family response regulator